MIVTCEQEHPSDQTSVAELVLLNEGKVKPKLGGEQEFDSWYLDSGASNHVTDCKEVFSDLDETVKGLVRFGDGSVVEIHERQGAAAMYFIPRLRSKGQLAEVRCKTVIDGGFMQLTDREKLQAIVRSRNRLYILRDAGHANHARIVQVSVCAQHLASAQQTAKKST
jgi:hypothetical protein